MYGCWEYHEIWFTKNITPKTTINMKLHESFKKQAKDLSYNEPQFEVGYIYGCSDFQAKAIKELERLRALSAGSEYWDTYNSAIEIIKNLKA